jgi:hypothetical protein
MLGPMAAYPSMGNEVRLTLLSWMLLSPAGLIVEGTICRRPGQVITAWRSTVPLRASSVPVAVVAIAENMPEAPPDDPIVPATVRGDTSVVPPSCFWGSGMINALDLSVSRCFSDHCR